MNSRKQIANSKWQTGFTLVELLVSVAIFVSMTALFVVKYGTFNQSVLLTNLAYDIALNIRTAQTYGLSGKGTGIAPEQLSVFQNTYGVSFSTVAPYNGRMILYSSPLTKPQVPDNYMFSRTAIDEADTEHTGDVIISKSILKRGAVISRLCVGTGSCPPEGQVGSGNVNELSIDFLRPDPSATICAGDVDFGAGSNTVQCVPTETYAEIDVRAVDGNVRTIQVRSSGQISVVN